MNRKIIIMVCSGIMVGLLGIILMPEKKVDTIAITSSAVTAQIIWDFIINPYLDKKRPKTAFIKPK